MKTVAKASNSKILMSKYQFCTFSECFFQPTEKFKACEYKYGGLILVNTNIFNHDIPVFLLMINN